MRDARVGAVLRLADRGPPWIVVDFALDRIIVANWPGRLWRVRVIEAASARDQRQAGGQPNHQATYLRAIAVEILSEQSPAVLFGPHGSNLISLFEQAASLNSQTAQRLAAARSDAAPAAYDRVMRRWAQAAQVAVWEDNLDGVLKIGGGSPINGGLATLHRVVFERAISIGGPDAIAHDGEAVTLNEPWATAAKVASDAALALGAPQFASGTDRRGLLEGWTSALT